MTKIDIISGFLGAGKTTFIKKLLEEAIAGEEVVLIENEFGEIGIDGGFLKDSGIEIREMNSGCICCSLVGDFGRSLEEVLTKYHPDRVVIEPSGVGKLSDVMNAVRDVAAKVEVTLNSAVTIVDAAKCKMYMKNFGEFFNNQIENAGTVVLSRTDIASPEVVDKAVAMIREHNPNAVVVTTPCTQLSGTQLLELIEKPDTMLEDLMKDVEEHHHHSGDEEVCSCGHEHHHEEEEACSCGHEHHHDGEACSCGHEHHHEEDECNCGHDHHHEHGEACGCGCEHHHADEVFTSWGMEHVTPIAREDLNQILDALAYDNCYGDVLRAKGMVPGKEPDKWYYFDMVPEQYDIREGLPHYTGKLCVIGANLKEDELKKAFGR